MNRQNFLGHLALAVTIVLVAAFAGQLRRWDRQRKHRLPNKPTIIVATDDVQSQELRGPEVLVRFRQGTSGATIRGIAKGLNDNIEDEIESVDGLVALDDLDNADPQSVADEYSRMTDLVEYAEPNYQISLDPQLGKFGADPMADETKVVSDDVSPDDPMFGEQ